MGLLLFIILVSYFGWWEEVGWILLVLVCLALTVRLLIWLYLIWEDGFEVNLPPTFQKRRRMRELQELILRKKANGYETTELEKELAALKSKQDLNTDSW